MTTFSYERSIFADKYDCIVPDIENYIHIINKKPNIKISSIKVGIFSQDSLPEVFYVQAILNGRCVGDKVLCTIHNQPIELLKKPIEFELNSEYYLNLGLLVTNCIPKFLYQITLL